ncbi:MAG: nucleotide exchange factor GrpE [Candidatus Paceibacterota bacterium]
MEKQKPQKQNKELEDCKKQTEEYLNGWKRAQADFINYKNSEGQRMEEFAKFANEGLMAGLIELADEADLAWQHMPEDVKKDNQDWVSGASEVRKKFYEFLEKQGLEKIKTVGEDFNPLMHESVGEVPAENTDSGKVVEEVRSGYTLHGKVVRPARVKISK